MKLLRFAMLAALPFLSSCTSLVGTAPEPGKDRAAATEAGEVKLARERLDTVRRQIAAGRFEEADATLAPLAGGAIYPAEVAELKAKIAAGRERGLSGATLRQVAVARRLAFKDQYDEAEAILETLDADGPGKEEIREVRELINLRRIQHPALAARKHVPEIRSLIKRGEFATAEALLDAIEGGGAIPEEVAALKLELKTARDRATIALGQEASANRALAEVGQRLILPSTYGNTVVISPNLSPLEMPVGTMEDLINKRVSIQLENAGVKELVQVLSQVDGLNIIADDALEAANALTINVRNVPLKEVLSYIARNMGIAFHLGDNIVWVTQSTEPPGAGPKLETRIFHLRQGFIPSLDGNEDTELEDALDAFLADSPDGAGFRTFKTRNVLIVRDTRENLRLVEELVRTFDKPPYQVLIEARFITISQDDLRDVGSEISTTRVTPLTPEQATTQLQATSLLSSLGALPTDNEAGVGHMELSGVLGNRAFNLVVSALEKRGSAKNLSAPRITVLNNRSARIRRGNKTLYYSELETVAGNITISDTAPSSATVFPAQTAFTGDPEELETGVTLDVKVNVGNDGKTVLLGLMPEIIELSRWRSFNVVAGSTSTTSNNSGTDSSSEDTAGKVELPETSESSLQTAVSVRSGETVALGGLVTSTVQKTVTKVPVLGDIPLIGFFFRHTNEKDVPQHLLIFVTARVIDENGNFVQVVD